MSIEDSDSDLDFYITNKIEVGNSLKRLLFENLKEVQSAFRIYLDLNDFEYNHKCVQISDDLKILFVAATEQNFDVLFSFSDDNLFVVCGESTYSFHISGLAVSEAGDITNNNNPITNNNNPICTFLQSQIHRNEPLFKSIKSAFKRFVTYNIYMHHNKQQSVIIK